MTTLVPSFILKVFKLYVLIEHVISYGTQSDTNWHFIFRVFLVSVIYAVDIHPAAKIGSGILLDHATGFVAGETSVIEDDVSILHEVTLGGTGKERGDRHPKIRSGVLIGAGAKILGNVEIGEGARVGASSVVLHDVPPRVSVAGVPAKVVGQLDYGDLPYLGMDHKISKEPNYESGGGI